MESTLALIAGRIGKEKLEGLLGLDDFTYTLVVKSELYRQIPRYEQSLKALFEALRISKTLDGKEKENWLSLNNELSVKLEDMGSAADREELKEYCSGIMSDLKLIGKCIKSYGCKSTCYDDIKNYVQEKLKNRY